MAKINKYFIYVFIIIAGAFVFSPSLSFASDLGFSPSTFSLSVNKSFSVNIILKNNNQAINAVSGTISFPTDLLSVKSISKTGGIVKIWPAEPTYSNDNGTINFDGIVLNPGFSGTEGSILTIKFTTKASGTANLKFSSGQVLANDGKATSVLNKLDTASFMVSENNNTPESPSTSVPDEPKIFSSTNPDSLKWYNSPKPSFSWDVPSGISAVRILYDTKPSSTPVKIYQPVIAKKTFDSVTDGTYYLHVQFKNSSGWGQIAHFKFQVDTTLPNPFSISFPHGSESDNPQPIILFNTTDNTSGINHYEVKIGDGDLLSYAPEALSNPYAMPPQNPGKHTVQVTAIDQAGNKATNSADFVINSIKSPNITNYPTELSEDDILKIRGTSYADASITFFLKDKDGVITTEITKSNSLGDFGVVWTKKLSPGIYELTVQTIDNRGAKSELTSPIKITVEQRIILRIGSIILNYLTISIIGFLSLSILAFFVIYIMSRLVLIAKKLRKEVSESGLAIHEDIESLREDFKAEIQLLELARGERELTKEEKTLLQNLENRVNSTKHNKKI